MFALTFKSRNACLDNKLRNQALRAESFEKTINLQVDNANLVVKLEAKTSEVSEALHQLQETRAALESMQSTHDEQFEKGEEVHSRLVREVGLLEEALGEATCLELLHSEEVAELRSRVAMVQQQLNASAQEINSLYSQLEASADDARFYEVF